MATVKQPVIAKASLTVTGLATLAAGSYATSATKDNTANQPSDLFVELSITPGTVSGTLPSASLFALGSLDNTVFQTGANATDEADMTFIGTLPLNTSATPQTKIFTVAASYGALPPYTKFVVRNNSGSAFTAGSINVSEVSLTVA